MEKLLAKWVPRVLTPEQKENRIICSERSLAVFQQNPTEFVSRLVTMDETWIHHYTSESSQSAAGWRGKDESRTKRPKTQQSAGKVLANVFLEYRWDIIAELSYGR